MQLVEQHRIRRCDPRFAAIDQAAFAAKNLYNQANYQVRQAFIKDGTYLSYVEVFRLLKTHEAYTALPRKVSNAILIHLHRNWLSFFAAVKAYRDNPTKFTGRPKLPGYKHKEYGRFPLVYEKKALGKRLFDTTGKLVPSGLPIAIHTQRQWHDIAQVRIVPRSHEYVVEVVYEQAMQTADTTGVDPTVVAALDVGVNVLAALTSNKPGFVPRLVSGKILKSLNQFYNKQRAKEQARLAHERDPQRHTSRHLDQITMKRNRRVNGILHTASRRIIDLLVTEGMGTLVIGKNPLWKQDVRMGKRNNQAFVQIPHARFIEMLSYKAQLVGIQVILQEESYTSKASFLDGDPIPTYHPDHSTHPEPHVFSGKRISRSWYQAKDGRIIHADVNGSYNILCKSGRTSRTSSTSNPPSNSDPNQLMQVGRGVAGAAVHPRRLAV